MQAVNSRPVDPAVMPTGVLLSAADFDELVRELESLRSRHHADLAERLRDARAFGSPADDDDRLAVFEDVAVDQARIAQLEQLVRYASVVDEALTADGGAGLGSIVRVKTESGRTAEYELVGRRSLEAGDRQVSLGSPVGDALIGARPGDVVHVALPSGRDRALRVFEVSAGNLGLRATAA